MEQATWQPANPIAHEKPEFRRHSRLSVMVASNAGTIEDAQRLRYKVFAEELGASLQANKGLDADEFDPYCDHLVVRDETTLRVVGNYRLLPPHQARRIGRLYSEAEFDLRRLGHLRPTMVELGRSCIHRDYRNGSALMMLWAGLARYMKANRYTHAIGCASTTLADGGHLAAYVRDEIQRYLAPVDCRAFPRLPFPHEQIERPTQAVVPSLIRAHLRAGAVVCGEPAWDPEFGTADFLMLIAFDNVNGRYARHFALAPNDGAYIKLGRTDGGTLRD